MKTYSIYNTFTDELVAIIKTNQECKDEEFALDFCYTLDFYFNCGLDIYAICTPNKKTDIILNECIM